MEEENWLHFRFADVHSFPEPAYGADAKTTSMPIVHYRGVSLIDGSVPLESGFSYIYFLHEKKEMFYNFSKISPKSYDFNRTYRIITNRNCARVSISQRGGKEGNARRLFQEGSRENSFGVDHNETSLGINRFSPRIGADKGRVQPPVRLSPLSQIPARKR